MIYRIDDIGRQIIWRSEDGNLVWRRGYGIHGWEFWDKFGHPLNNSTYGLSNWEPT